MLIQQQNNPVSNPEFLPQDRFFMWSFRKSTFEAENWLLTLLMCLFSKAQGFHSEIEDFLLELTRMETQLSASKPTGGLPETAREQLDTHMVMEASWSWT